MSKLTFSIHINASREKVWERMLGETWTEWAKVFDPGAFQKGNRSVGSLMYFMEGSGNNGMIFKVIENRFPEYFSMELVGQVKDKVEVMNNNTEPAMENYSYT